MIPPITIKTFVADGKTQILGSPVRLSSKTANFQISYTALSLSIPERVKFRYRLDGLDDSWQDAGLRREAYFSRLRPGRYTFHVIACNGDGLWNETGAAITFDVIPTFFQTTWFALLCVLCGASIIWIAYTVRIRYVTAQIQHRVGAQMEERERIARELHDTLLQGFHGLMLRFQAIMKVLPADGPAREMMGDVLDRADEVLLEGRDSVRDLRESGMVAGELSAMLATAGEELSQSTSTLFSFVVVGDPRALDPVAFKETYRIVREALSNAFQHSQGTKIELELTYDDSGCSVRVRDDGIGIDSVILGAGKIGHWGLSGMRERAQKLGAAFNIWSKAGAGTEVELTVPATVAFPQTRKKTIWWQARRPSKQPGGKLA